MMTLQTPSHFLNRAPYSKPSGPANANERDALQRMQEDARRIRDKEADQGELTAGQAAALLNCERGCDKLREEAEELEETLQDSLRDAAAGRRAAGKLEVRDTRKRRQRERGDSDSDDDRDDFYDRTRPKGKVAKAGGEKMALTVETLCARLHEREAEAAALAEKIAQVRHRHRRSVRDLHVGL